MTRGLGGLFGLLRRPASAAVAGQVSQALAALVLQVAAARFLGAAGLATFSLIYGLLILVAGVASGMVGDSLTVLDRAEPRIRAGLHVWALLVAGGAGLVGGVAAAVTGVVPPWAAVVLGLAVTAFVLEDTLRRLLMATGRFWSLSGVDVTSLLVALGTLVLCAAAGPLTLGSFLVALLAGQTVAGVVAWVLAPAGERPRGPWRSPDLRTVWSFGVWRAATHTVRPALLTGLRVILVGLVGAAAYGPVEAARMYTAPCLMLVTGLGTFLLPHYVATRDQSVDRTLRSADRVALWLAGAVAGTAAVAVVFQPVVEPLLTGGAFPMPVLAVVGWGVYAAASAVLLPYAGLATVLRRQRLVLMVRLLEFAGLVGVWAVASFVDGGENWGPMVLGVGPLLAALGIRQGVLRPIARGRGPVERAPATEDAAVV